jgi:rhodanese-related sulfurtransferase
MKKLSFYLIALLITLSATLSSFSVKENPVKRSANNLDEFEVLVNYLENNGNYINTAAPSLLSPGEVKKNTKNQKYHIIDIRSDSWFEYGHIKNAHNVKPSELLNYFENKIEPTNYDKIVLVCYSGQSAAYYTSLLRLAGYDNTYSMKWGMSSWRADFAEKSWTKYVKADHSDKLETKENTKLPKGNHPVLNTGKTDPKDILRARLEERFATPYRESIVKCTDVFENPGNYYTINCCPEEVYKLGHLPGAVHYDPHSLSADKDLYTLPADKKVVVYDLTGQGSAYIVAYLNVLGYQGGNIGYGANSFMNKELKAKGLDAFSKKQINMYPVVE